MSFVVYALFKATGPRAAAARQFVTQAATEGQSDLQRLGVVAIPEAQRRVSAERLRVDLS
jgi:ABC-type phosphate transport system substrate-binding protein